MTRDPRIDAYLARSAPFARTILEHVRERVHAVVDTVEESIKWGAPAYLKDGRILIITAAFKGHAALNFWRGNEIAGGDAKPGANGQFGKLTSLDDLPANLDALIAEAAALADAPAARRPQKDKPKAEVELHPDFGLALESHPDAKATLDGFSASARRDYLEWIAEAKQDATRAKRIATAIEWLAEGKKRHWKYERC